jgi:hypothetical protein
VCRGSSAAGAGRRHALGAFSRRRSPAGVLCRVAAGSRAGCGVRKGGAAMAASGGSLLREDAMAEPTRITPAQVRESTSAGSNVLQTV